MKLVTATANCLYADTDQVLTSDSAALLKAAGFKGVIRYLSGMTRSELAAILGADLECYFANYSRNPGWIPSAAEGLQDALRDLTCLASLGISTGVHVEFDLEGPSAAAPIEDLQQHLAAHGNKILQSGNFPSLYVGASSLLSSKQLYDLPSVLYHQSCSELVDAAGVAQVPQCGYAIVQGRPFNVKLSNSLTEVTVDYDYVMADLKGRLPIGVSL